MDRPDLTHQYVARCLMQECAHLMTAKDLSFLNMCARVSALTDRQESYLMALERRREETVR